VKELQRNFLTDSQKIDVTIETIDRVQGITVDYAILYFPLRNIGFAMDERRFNVATSRSRSTTLILTDIELLERASVAGNVRTFISKAVRI
jgi:superfamily I DNA and/or RNA helicase